MDLLWLNSLWLILWFQALFQTRKDVDSKLFLFFPYFFLSFNNAQWHVRTEKLTAVATHYAWRRSNGTSHKFPMANQVWNVSKKLVPQPTTHLSLINHLQAQQFLLREVYLWLVCPFQETVNEENSSKIQFVRKCSSHMLFAEPPQTSPFPPPLWTLCYSLCSLFLELRAPATQKSKPASKTSIYLYYSEEAFLTLLYKPLNCSEK
jgi:hypothetical protein